MQIDPFRLERHFARYEFSVKYLLSSSDCESLSLAELLQIASPESLSLWQNLKLGYTESPGHPLLRYEVSRLYEHISSENVMIAAPEEAIFIAMQSLLNPGDHVIVLTPTYQSLYENARSIGCKVTSWELEPSPQGWSLDLDRLKRSITGQTRLLVLNFPNNPTGYMPTSAQLEAILDIARKHGLMVFSDEMYRLLEQDPSTRLPSVADIYEKGISLSGLSKSFALPGLRIGWLTTQESSLIEQWLSLKDYTTICNSAPSEVLGIIALQNTNRIVMRSLEIIHKNIAIADLFFNRHDDKITWIHPQAGSISFNKWHGDGTVEQFCQHVLEQQGVMIVPGSLFDYPGEYFRIGLGRNNFAEALEHVDKFLSPSLK